ncbi:hypothetical protein BASA50_002685 [Batrachochytrium salamandrivorans]|uniref:Uncharacterized protein n=1 Tax=Batrachochytrium salamandrivorans TaxID=1357716 RepID=A0ABQ8FKN0_9FUNG|nr:hypothetical protein BASA50_002685 [Batrachochytrium salamandrivorans]
MKLISFAVISLLAITVSAQVLPSTSSVEYTLQHDQYDVDEKLAELRAAYKTEMEKDLKLEDFWLAKREVEELRLEVQRLKDAMKRKGITKVEKLDTRKLYISAHDELQQAYATVFAKKKDLEKAKEKCDNAKIELHTIEENQRRIKEHNAIRQNQVEISPCSYYSIDILKIQSDEVCKNAKSLATYNKKIKTGVSEPDTVMHKTKSSIKSTHPKAHRNSHDPHQELMKEIRFAQRHCSYIKNLHRDLTRQSLGLRVGRTCQSFVQRLGMN